MTALLLGLACFVAVLASALDDRHGRLPGGTLTGTVVKFRPMKSITVTLGKRAVVMTMTAGTAFIDEEERTIDASGITPGMRVTVAYRNEGSTGLVAETVRIRRRTPRNH